MVTIHWHSIIHSTKVKSRHTEDICNHFKKTNYSQACAPPFLPYTHTKPGGVFAVAGLYPLAALVANSASAGTIDTDLAFLPLFRVEAFCCFWQTCVECQI